MEENDKWFAQYIWGEKPTEKSPPEKSTAGTNP